MSDCLCDRCAGLCCRYFALPIDNPTTRRDYDNVRWYLLHERVVVFVEGGQWFIGILNPCKALGPDNRCGVYETRPAICRGYATDNCDYHGGDYGYDHLFTSADALWTFAVAELERARVERRVKRAKPPTGSRRAARARELSEGRTLPLTPDLRAGTAEGLASAGGRQPLVVGTAVAAVADAGAGRPRRKAIPPAVPAVGGSPRSVPLPLLTVGPAEGRRRG